jgi:hypothetical protein
LDLFGTQPANESNIKPKKQLKKSFSEKRGKRSHFTYTFAKTSIAIHKKQLQTPNPDLFLDKRRL